MTTRPKIDDRYVAQEHLLGHFRDTRTADDQPSVVSPVPADVFRQAHGFVFAVVWVNGSRSIMRVGPRGGIETWFSFTEFGWRWLETEWRHL